MLWPEGTTVIYRGPVPLHTPVFQGIIDYAGLEWLFDGGKLYAWLITVVETITTVH
jgi:hypothetical protein